MTNGGIKQALALFGERLLVAGGLIIISLVSWAYTAQMARTMAYQGPDVGAMTATAVHHAAGHGAPHAVTAPHFAAWGMAEAGMTFLMWTVMMAAMMLPTAIPMVWAFAGVNRQRETTDATMPIWAFTAGYLAIWAVYSAGATVAQMALLWTALLSPITLASGPLLGGSLLIAAGIFQWTPWKDACMTKCRNPFGFLLTHWQSGRGGAFRLGTRYGLYCVGCCWLLMMLSFALGVMNLLWMALLTVFMLIEKIAPAGRLISRIAGVGLIGWGGWMVY